MDFWVWIIIMVVVALAKGWGKLTEQIDQDKEESPPPATPRPPLKRAPKLRNAQPRPPPVQPRPVGAPPSMPPPVRQAAPTGPRTQRARFEREGAHPLVAQALPKPAPVLATAAPPPSSPSRAPQPEPARASRGSQWAEAMRDKQNIRNVIIATEILGPPKGA